MSSCSAVSFPLLDLNSLSTALQSIHRGAVPLRFMVYCSRGLGRSKLGLLLRCCGGKVTALLVCGKDSGCQFNTSRFVYHNN